MTTATAPIEGRLRMCGFLILLGSLINLASLFSSHPMSFLFFAFLGGPLILGGGLLYLYSLVTTNGEGR